MQYYFSFILFLSLGGFSFGQEVYIPPEDLDLAICKEKGGDNIQKLFDLNRDNRQRRMFPGTYRIIFKDEVDPVTLEGVSGSIIKTDSYIEFKVERSVQVSFDFNGKLSSVTRKNWYASVFMVYDPYHQGKYEPFVMKSTDGRRIDSEDRKGKISILLIWQGTLLMNEYREKYQEEFRQLDQYLDSSDEIDFFIAGILSKNHAEKCKSLYPYDFTYVYEFPGTKFPYKKWISYPRYIILDRQVKPVFWHLGDTHNISEILISEIDRMKE